MPAGVEKVGFTTDDGVRIYADYYANDSGAPSVILLHMYSRTRADWREFALFLQSRGYSVLALDMRGHGESGGGTYSAFGMQEWLGVLNDVSAGKEFLRSRGADTTRLSVIGASIGANLALRYAAQDGEVKTVVLLSPGLDYRGVTTEDAMVDYGARPLLIVASEDDKYSAQTARRLDSLAQGEHKLIIYPAADHGTRMFGREPGLAQEIAGWLDEHSK